MFNEYSLDFKNFFINLKIIVFKIFIKVLSEKYSDDSLDFK